MPSRRNFEEGVFPHRRAVPDASTTLPLFSPYRHGLLAAMPLHGLRPHRIFAVKLEVCQHELERLVAIAAMPRLQGKSRSCDRAEAFADRTLPFSSSEKHISAGSRLEYGILLGGGFN